MLWDRAQAGSYFARKRNRNAVLGTDLSSHAWGRITFATNSGQTIHLGGTLVTLGTDVSLGASLAATLAALVTFLNASLDSGIKQATYTTDGTSLLITVKAAGVATMTLSASAATVYHSPVQLAQARQRVAL